jgi:opacity protein-like surface antigen
MTMLRRVVIGAALACLLGGSAYAVDGAQPEGDDECTQKLAASEEAVQNKVDANTISEDDMEKANELLDQADAQCTEGDLAGATETLAKVNGIVAK